MAQIGCKRGDAQLMHRGASAIVKHGLPTDMSKRCLDKEEWVKVRDCTDRESALALLDKMQSEKRAKAVGVNTWSAGLGMIPEDAIIRPRKLAAAMEAGTEEAYSAFMAPFLK